jgi:hypothetical protein
VVDTLQFRLVEAVDADAVRGALGNGGTTIEAAGEDRNWLGAATGYRPRSGARNSSTNSRSRTPPLAKGTQEAYLDSLKSLRTCFVSELRVPSIDAIHARHVRDFLAWRKVNRLETERE